MIKSHTRVFKNFSQGINTHAVTLIFWVTMSLISYLMSFIYTWSNVHRQAMMDKIFITIYRSLLDMKPLPSLVFIKGNGAT